MKHRRTTGPPAGTRAIIAYFLAYPEACDSLEGIARWRLLEAQVTQTLERTARAVRWLVGREFLLEHAAATGVPTFQLNPLSRPAAEQFVLEPKRRRSHPCSGTRDPGCTQ